MLHCLFVKCVFDSVAILLSRDMSHDFMKK